MIHVEQSIELRISAALRRFMREEWSRSQNLARVDAITDCCFLDIIAQDTDARLQRALDDLGAVGTPPTAGFFAWSGGYSQPAAPTTLAGKLAAEVVQLQRDLDHARKRERWLLDQLNFCRSQAAIPPRIVREASRATEAPAGNSLPHNEMAPGSMPAVSPSREAERNETVSPATGKGQALPGGAVTPGSSSGAMGSEPGPSGRAPSLLSREFPVGLDQRLYGGIAQSSNEILGG